MTIADKIKNIFSGRVSRRKYSINVIITQFLALLVTDEYMGYINMNDTIPHLSVNHSCEYVNGDIHTNTMESFGAILKRGLIGQFHKVSKKYLQNYLDEFEYRYNKRTQSGNDVFENLLKRCVL